MNQPASPTNRIVHYLLLLAFVVSSYYTYTLIGNTSSIENELTAAFLLSSSIGGALVMVSSLLGKLGLLKMVNQEYAAYDVRIPASVIGASVAVASFYAYTQTRIALLLVPIPAMLVFAVLSLRNIYPFIGRVDVRPFTEDKIVKFVTSRGRLRKLAEDRRKYFATLLAQAGEVGNPYILASKTLVYTVSSFVVAMPLAIILAVLVWYPLGLIAFVPIITYYLPGVRLRDAAGQRREGLERELPFFSILVNVLGTAGIPLYTVFEDVISTKMFQYMRKEALLVRRDVRLFGSDPIEAFERLAATHPSKKLSTFLYGYTAKVRSGGDMPAYLSGESANLLRALEEAWTRYSQRVSVIGSMMITIFGILPMMLLVVSVFSPASATTSMMLFTAIGIPVFAALLTFMAGRMQPVGEDPLVGNLNKSILFSAPAGLGISLLTQQVWVGLASALFVFFTMYGYSVMDQRRQMREVDDAMPEFMKDLMEYKRQEYDLTKAIIAISAHNNYTPTFDKLIKTAATQLATGTPMDELVIDPKSRLGRMVFFTLGQMNRSGGGTVETFYQLTTYTTRVVEMRSNTIAELRPYMYLAVLSPLLLAFGVNFMTGVLGQFSSLVGSQLGNTNSPLSIGQFTPQLKEIANFLIVVSSAALGIISAKMVDFTVKYTIRASVNVIVAVIVTYVLSLINLGALFRVA